MCPPSDSKETAMEYMQSMVEKKNKKKMEQERIENRLNKLKM